MQMKKQEQILHKNKREKVSIKLGKLQKIKMEAD